MALETFTLPAHGPALFEAVPDHFALEDDNTTDNWMELELDPTSPCMALFQEVLAVQEVQEDSKEQEQQDSMLLEQLISECGIPVEPYMELPATPCSPCSSTVSSESDMENHQSLIEELEDFFGSPTMLEEDNSMSLDLIGQTTRPYTTISPEAILSTLTSDHQLTSEDLRGAITTSCVTEDGQSVIIIIAPPSPSISTSTMDCTTDYTTDYTTDPEWLPSSAPASPPDTCLPARRKYARKIKPSPPSGPYPTERRERKKAQNRTAAFRYRERKKGEAETVEQELERVAERHSCLQARLQEMEVEARLLKRMMAQAGLGRYAEAIRL